MKTLVLSLMVVGRTGLILLVLVRVVEVFSIEPDTAQIPSEFFKLLFGIYSPLN